MALFKNDYQGGSHLEILSSQGTTIKNWKLRGVKKIYQSDLKGSCHHVEGGKLNLPKNDKLHLYLYQPYLLFQLYITSGMPISIELCLIDMNNNHRRFLISTNNKETKTTALHISCPFPDLIKGQWMNVCFDLVNLLSDNFKGFTYKRLDSIGLNGTFRLRKICTIKDRPPETQMDNYSKYSDFKSIVELPKSILLPSDILSSTIVYDMQRILRIENRSLNTNDVIPAIMDSQTQHPIQTHIAFGVTTKGKAPSIYHANPLIGAVRSKSSISSRKNTPDLHVLSPIHNVSKESKHSKVEVVKRPTSVKSKPLAPLVKQLDITEEDDLFSDEDIDGIEEKNIRDLELMEFKKSFISNESNNKNVQHTTELIKRPVEEDKKETVYEDKDIRVSPDQSPINLQVAGITEHVQAQDLTHKALEGLRAIDEIEEDIAEYSEQSNTSMNSFSKFDNRDLFPHSIDEEDEGIEDNIIPEGIHFTNGHNANQVLESKVIGNDSDNNRSGKEEHINELYDVSKYSQIKTTQSDTEEDDCIPENITPEISQSTTTTYQIQNECILQTFESKLVPAADNNTPMKSFIPKRTNIVRSISRNSVQSVTKTIRSISRQSVDSQSLKLTSSGGVIMPSQQYSEQCNAKIQESVTDTYQSNLTLHSYDTLHKESLEQISEIKSTSSDSTKLKANIKSSKTPLESKRIAPAAEPNQETEALKPWDIQEGHQLFQSYLSETDRLSLGPPADESDEELKQSMQERILARLEGYNMNQMPVDEITDDIEKLFIYQEDGSSKTLGSRYLPIDQDVEVCFDQNEQCYFDPTNGNYYDLQDEKITSK